MTRVSAFAHCPTCKEELQIGLPLEISVVAAVGKAFAKSHKLRCKAIAKMGPAPGELGRQSDTPQKESNG